MKAETIARAADRFHAAGLANLDWMEALDELGALTGAASAQLVGLGDRAVSFNYMTHVAPEHIELFALCGGGDPAVNSRVRRGIAAEELVMLDEADFTTAEDRRRFPDYGAWIDCVDAAFVCLTSLVKLDDNLIGTAIVRSGKQGPITSEGKRAFAHLAPHMRAAARTQLAFEGQGMTLLTSAMAALDATVFVCDRHGRVQAMSPRAEALVVEGRWLQMRHGRLNAHRGPENQRLHAALHKTCLSRGVCYAPPHQAFALHDADGYPLPVETAPMPSEHNFRFSAASLLIAHPPRDQVARATHLAGVLFGLTPGESRVAGYLTAGYGPRAVASLHGVSVATVRTQIRSILEKSGLSSQIELVAALSSRF